MTIRHHREHLLDRAAMVAVRLMLGSAKGSVSGPSARNAFNDLMAKVPPAAGVTYHQETIGTVSGRWCRPEEPLAGAAILYLHGGGYVVGSAEAYQHFAGHVAARAQAAVFVPDYRLAPEFPFPSAVEDAQESYAGLLAQGFTNIALAGDSAGGGISLILLSFAARLRPDPEGRRGDLRLDGPCAHRREHDYPRGRRSTINPIFSRSARKSLPWRPRQPRP